MNKYTLLQTFGEKGREPRAAELVDGGRGSIVFLQLADRMQINGVIFKDHAMEDPTSNMCLTGRCFNWWRANVARLL